MQAKLTIRTIASLQPQPKPYEVVDSEITGFLLRVQPSGIMTYYLSYRLKNGKKHRFKIGRHGSITIMQARDVAAKLSAQVITGKDIQEEKKHARQAAEKAQARTLAGFLQTQYEPWVQVERKTGNETLKRIRYNFMAFLPLPLDEINPRLIEKWRYEQLKNGKLATTVNRDITTLRAVLSKAVNWDLLEIHPLSKLKPVKTDSNKIIRYLSDEEEDRLRKALIAREERIKLERTNANQWRLDRGYEQMLDLTQITFADYLRPMVLLSINTGLRRGELFSLTWIDIDFDKAILTVGGAVSKSGKTRHVPLNAEAQDVLVQWRKQNNNFPLIFSAQNGKRLDNVRKSWGNVLKKAEIANFRWHDMRHHFASRLVMAGIDLNTVRELLGHADLKTTLRYAHLAPKHKANAVAHLAPNYIKLA